MTMHLVGPWLSTTGKKKGKRKFRNAEEAKKARELNESWERLLQRHNVEQSERKRTPKGIDRSLYVSTKEPYRRETPYIPSKGATNMAPATKQEPQKYTGTLIKGIATMHKSNAVPVLNDQDAVDIAKMRR